ncbi:MAG: alpha/beta hydrolase family protein [Treponemataceae bacterium]
MEAGPEEHLEKLYRDNTPEFAFRAKTPEEARVWKDSLKAIFLKDLGGFPHEKTALRPRIIEEEQCDGYVRQRVVITTDDQLDMPLYLLIPDNRKGKLPVVVTCHGHGTGSRDNVGLKPDGSFKEGDHGYSKSFGLELVKQGFLVVAPEILGFAERMFKGDMNRWPEVRNSCHRLSTYYLTFGKTLTAARVYEIFRTIDYLETRPEADMQNIGCMGISGGGLVGAYASIFDERIKASVISGFTNTFKDSFLAMQHCVCMFTPGVLRHAEMPDLIGLIAPRPLLIEAGIADKNFPIAGVRKALSELETVYRVWGCEQSLAKDIFDGGHEVSGKIAYDWLERQLR